MAQYIIPVTKKLLIALFANEIPDFRLSKADARCLLWYLEEYGCRLEYDVIAPQLYLNEIDEKEVTSFDIYDLVTYCADRNYDMQEEERSKEQPDPDVLFRLKRDNNRFDRLVERMGE